MSPSSVENRKKKQKMYTPTFLYLERVLLEYSWIILEKKKGSRRRKVIERATG